MQTIRIYIKTKSKITSSTAPRQCMSQFSLPPRGCKSQSVGHTRIFVWPEQDFIITSIKIGNSRVNSNFCLPHKKPGRAHTPTGPTFPRGKCKCLSSCCLLRKQSPPLPNKLHPCRLTQLCSMQIHGLQAPAGKRACTQRLLSPTLLSSAASDSCGPLQGQKAAIQNASKRLEQVEIQGSPETHSSYIYV